MYEVGSPKASRDYFIPDYKKVGEKYNAPMPHTYHFPGWKKFAKYAESTGIQVINCSPESALDYFPKSTLSEEFSTLA
jgi:hypothetical protein